MKKKIGVNTSKARSEIKVLRFLAQLNDWREVFNMDGDVLWAGLPLASDELGICLEIMTNRIPGAKELSHKKEMGYYLNKFREYYPEVFTFFPRTFLLPEQQEEFHAFSKQHGGLYIAKPTSGSQGDGIKIIKTYKDLNLSEYQPHLNELIVQQYVANPMLIDGKKFDFRLYVLISSIEPFIVYLNNEGLVRFCAEKYELPNNQNIKNSFMHFTNYHLNKDHPDFKLPEETDDILGKNFANKRTYTSVLKQIKEMGYDVAKIQADIDKLVINFMTSMNPFIVYFYKTAFGGKPGKCFQVLGFDILLDDKGRPWLLEINANPSFNIEHDIYHSTGKTETEPSPLDKYIKAKVVGDAIRIVTRKVSAQQKTGKLESYRSFKMLINDDLSEQEMEVFTNILRIYGKLSGYKFRGSITGSRFVKLASFQGMTSQAVTKTDYDIIFKKILCQSGNTALMTFYDFIAAMEYLASKLCPNYNAQNKQPAMQELLNNIIHQIEEL